MSHLTSGSLVSDFDAQTFVYANMKVTDQGSLSTESLPLGIQNASGSLSNPNLPAMCMVTPPAPATTTIHSAIPLQQSTRTGQGALGHRRSESAPWIAVTTDMHTQPSFNSNMQTKVDHPCIVSTSGVDMLQDLLTTATDAQRQLCPTGSCMPLQSIEAQSSPDNRSYCEQGTYSRMTREASVKSAEGLEALLPDVDCTALDDLSPESGRRLPRLVATVRHALDMWRTWEQDGFPLD